MVLGTRYKRLTDFILKEALNRILFFRTGTVDPLPTYVGKGSTATTKLIYKKSVTVQAKSAKLHIQVCGSLKTQ